MTTPVAELLYPDSAESSASLTYFPAPSEIATGAGVLVCPGGGYAHLAVDHEGEQIAQWLNQRGIAAWMLSYTIATPEQPGPLRDIPLQEAQLAMRRIRSRAEEYNLNAGKLGVWGFSAGGHLASTLATHWDEGDAQNEDTLEHFSCRPDFAILAYPVITMKNATHSGSRLNLLGREPSDDAADYFSNELQVSEKTPPTFLFHTGDDAGVPAANSVLFYMALLRHNIPAELHIYESGPHGVGLAPEDKVLSTWPQRLEDWLHRRGVIG
jgi:acetyl esterase/lipase